MEQVWTQADSYRDVAARIPRLFYSGKVTRVIGLIIEAYLPHVPIGALCHIRRENQKGHLRAEVIGLREEKALLMPVGELSGIQVGDEIEVVRQEVTVKVGAGLLGRILDGSGEPIDGQAPLSDMLEYPLYHPCYSPVTRKMISEPLSMGVRAMDGFLTTGIGQRMMVMAGSGVGKSTLMGMMARNASADVNVIGLIGERGREVREFLENDLGEEGLKKSIVIVATSDQPALVRMRAAFVTTSIAEYFRDQGKKVLIMMDSLTRFAMASREVGLSMGEPPTSKGYTPSLFSILPKLLERVGTTDGDGSITGLYTVLTEGDDIQDPIADAVRAIVDGHIVLSRKLNSMGHYPPIDVLQSLSRVMKNVVSKDHNAVMTELRRSMALYAEMEDFIKIGVYTPGKNPELDDAIAKVKEIELFLRQDVSEATKMAETLNWMKKITTVEAH